MIALERLQRLPFFAFMDEKQLKAVACNCPGGRVSARVMKSARRILQSDALCFLTEGSLLYYMVVIS